MAGLKKTLWAADAAAKMLPRRGFEAECHGLSVVFELHDNCQHHQRMVGAFGSNGS